MKSTEASDLVKTNNLAMQAFAQGNWAAAAAGLEKVLTMVTDPADQKKLGPTIYTLGAAYFNGANYPKAISTLQMYLQRFPLADRVADARLALARATFLNKDYEGAAKLFAEQEQVPRLAGAGAGGRGRVLQATESARAADRRAGKTHQARYRDLRCRRTAPSRWRSSTWTTMLEDKALDLTNRLQARIGVIDNVVP